MGSGVNSFDTAKQVEGFSIHPAKPLGSARRAAWTTATRFGVKTKPFYISRAEAEQDAAKAKELSGIQFIVVEALGI